MCVYTTLCIYLCVGRIIKEPNFGTCSLLFLNCLNCVRGVGIFCCKYVSIVAKWHFPWEINLLDIDRSTARVLCYVFFFLEFQNESTTTFKPAFSDFILALCIVQLLINSAILTWFFNTTMTISNEKNVLNVRH